MLANTAVAGAAELSRWRKLKFHFRGYAMALEITIKVIFWMAVAFVGLVGMCWLDDELGKWWKK